MGRRDIVTDKGTWVTQGFEAFRQGTFGNAGQNLYVSRAGVLQRIHQYDLNGDGHLDLVFCNSQNHWERPPAYVYSDPLGQATRTELPAEGAWSGAVADLNGDGYDDLVLGMWYNGIRKDLNAVIYYGSRTGLSERRQQQLPVPLCTAVAAGDFNGDGKPDLAFISDGRLRLFYQSELGFEPKRFVDLAVEGQQLAADDLDGDGYTDLVVRRPDGGLCIYWGAAAGLHAQRATPVPLASYSSQNETDRQARYTEYVEDASVLARVVRLDGIPYLFAPQTTHVALVPVAPDRTLGEALVLTCAQAMAVAVGDINGDGHDDLVFACRTPQGNRESSWIYWGNEAGFDDTRRTRLDSLRACDVAVGDLDGDGYDDVVLCQSHTDESYTVDSLVYRGGANGVDQTPARLACHDARRVFLTHTSAAAAAQIVFVNYYSRNKLGNIDPTIYFGGPDGFAPERRRHIPGWGAVEAIGCDINDDGRADLVLANAAENSVARDPGSYVLLNDPSGFPDEPSLTLPTTRAHGVCCADLNRDGYLDLVFCGFDNPELLIFYGGADGFDAANPARIRLEHEGTVYSEPRWIYLADLNNDGWLDLVVPQIAYDRSFILWGGPDGFSMARCQALSVVRGACARAADLTGNGYLDLIVGGHMPDLNGPHDSFAYIYWNGPDGLREDRRCLLPAKTINAMAVADFNNDGLLDLFLCSYHGGKERDVDSYIYWQRPHRGFAAADRTRLFTHSASGCVAADFDGDGWTDLAIAYHKVNGDHIGHSAVWWNGPDGFVPGRVTRLPTSGPHGMMAVEPGNIRDRGPAEYYTSRPFKLPAGASATSIAWEAELPPSTWVKAQVRFATSEDDLANAPWLDPAAAQSGVDGPQAIAGTAYAGHWMQYRLALGATNGCGSPRIRQVTVEFERR